jgi:hypothetical protein
MPIMAMSVRASAKLGKQNSQTMRHTGGAPQTTVQEGGGAGNATFSRGGAVVDCWPKQPRGATLGKGVNANALLQAGV